MIATQPDPTSDLSTLAEAYILTPATFDLSSDLSRAQGPDAIRLGGKAATLARLDARGLPVPAWCVVTPDAFWISLSPAARAALATAVTPYAANDALANLMPDPALLMALEAALVELTPAGELLAVRSSVGDEDGTHHSFAGQFTSFLNVPRAAVAARLVEVWRAAYAPQVYAYRQTHQLEMPPPAPAVLIQRMVAAEAAGVAFSADPVSGRRALAVVAATHGLGDQLAAGATTGDTWQVDRGGQIVARMVQQPMTPVLADATVLAVAALARRCAAELGQPQDIEWAWAAGRLYLLQSRPITTLAALPDPDGVYTLWDNSNIVESYGGMTTPLTYSFARRAYQEVYQTLCRILGVPQPAIAARQAVFANMIGYLHGRIYYNLLNWYRVLALLPGFKANRRFMEQMMGVKESLPATIVADLAATTWRDRLVDRLHLARMVVGLLLAALGLERRKARFYARLAHALGETPPDMGQWRADELLAYYRRLEQELLPQWDAPLVNDFFAMIFYGVLRQLTTAWASDRADDDSTGALHNDLLTGQGGMISAEPAARVQVMAGLVRTAAAQDATLLARLRSEQPRVALAAVAAHPPLHAAVGEYLAKFGERCLHELKLESPTLHDDPRPLLRAISQLAAQPVAPSPAHDPIQVRTQAEARMQAQLVGKPLRRWLFRWVLGQARARVRDRENLRFERTRVFGRARQILRALGARLYAAGALAAHEHVFFLTVDEIAGFVEGTAVTTDLRALVQLRRAEHVRWATLPALPARFATYGAVHEGNVFGAENIATTAPEPALAGDTLTGIGASPGRVQGRARIVADPLDASLAQGDIVVADHTDPSWIMILPLAGALVVERGSLLSHAAIVARELGIPAVVAAAGARDWLREGEFIAVDGRAGTVRRVRV